MRIPTSGLLSLFLLTIIILIPAVSAVQITESPDVVQKGDQITLTISDLPDGSSFSLLIGGKFAVVPGERFSFETRSFNMPFSLTGGTVSATTQGTRTTAFSVAKGDAIVQVGNAADANGYFTISKEYEITSGVYDYLTLSGRARTDTSVITSSMNLVGTKKGAPNSAISFTIDGIDNGEVYVTALVDGSQVLYKKVIVGNGVATVTPVVTTAEPTAEPTTEPSGTPTGETTVTATTTATSGYIINPTATSTTSADTRTSTRETEIPKSVFSSADRMVMLSAEGIDYAALLRVSEANPPKDWVMVSDAYKIAPDSLVFSTPATLAFTVPATSANYAYFIARLQNDQWVVVPSSAGSGTIETGITSVGTYALMAYTPESTLPSTTAAPGETTPDVTATLQGTPKVASIAQANPSASATTKPAPLDLLPVLMALGVCTAAVLVIRKK